MLSWRQLGFSKNAPLRKPQLSPTEHWCPVLPKRNPLQVTEGAHFMDFIALFLDVWCERGDSNPHGLLRQILSLVRLPIPPLSQPLISTTYALTALCVFLVVTDLVTTWFDGDTSRSTADCVCSGARWA